MNKLHKNQLYKHIKYIYYLYLIIEPLEDNKNILFIQNFYNLLLVLFVLHLGNVFNLMT